MRLSEYVRSLPNSNKNDDVNKILPRIYLGNYHTANDKQFFQDNNIKAVLNCTKDLPNFFRSSASIEYMRIPVDDSLKEIDIKKMYKFIPVMTKFIEKHADIQNQNILVHCVEGSQRSVTAIVCYLMEMHNKTMHQACEFVLKKRQKSFHNGHNVNFEKSIEMYSKKMKR